MSRRAILENLIRSIDLEVHSFSDEDRLSFAEWLKTKTVLTRNEEYSNVEVLREYLDNILQWKALGRPVQTSEEKNLKDFFPLVTIQIVIEKDDSLGDDEIKIELEGV